MFSIRFKILIIVPIASFSQINIEGTVNDIKGTPLIGANVYIKGTYNGTIANSEGKFNLSSISTTDSLLVISFVGYERKEVPILDISETGNRPDQMPFDVMSFKIKVENVGDNCQGYCLSFRGGADLDQVV